jgi:hypothetical protein
MNRKSLRPLHGERKPAEAIYSTDIKRRQMVENGGSLVMKLGNQPPWGYKYLGTVSYIYMTWQQLSNFTPLSLTYLLAGIYCTVSYGYPGSNF